jgi:hypothetical protein
MRKAWKFRGGTLDKTIFDLMVLFNEYQLPPRFAPDDIDVRTSFGWFAHT